MMTGRLIAIEGIDGTGKTTQARLLAEARAALLTRQPGDTRVGQLVRQMLLDPANSNLDDRAEALLVVADKAQHVVEVVEPALRAGRDVVTDRYTASTLAYQGYGRGLSRELLARLLRFATRGLEPHLTLLLDLDPRSRHGSVAGVSDRLESETASFRRRVRGGYLELAAADPDSWEVIDAARPVEEVSAHVRAAVALHLGGG